MLTFDFFVFIKFHHSHIFSVEIKLPFKVKVKYLLNHEDHFEGKAEFHKKEYSINIHSQDNEKIIRIPFSAMGVTDNDILVRVSGPSGVYVQDYVILKGQSESIEIMSDSIYHEISNKQDKFDTLEIFVK